MNKISAVILGLVVSTSSLATAAPISVGVYKQTSSTAGDCPNCEIEIKKAVTNTIEIVANNGWRGFAYYDKTKDQYQGFYEWTDPKYAGVVYTATFVYEGQTLRMDATHLDSKHNLTATYRKK
jgi:hypothetical protein